MSLRWQGAKADREIGMRYIYRLDVVSDIFISHTHYLQIVCNA